MEVVSYLPALTGVEGDLQTALDRVRAYRQLCAQAEWTGKDVAAAQTRAVQTIRSRVLSAANRLDLLPQNRQRLEQQLRAARDENEGLRATIDRLNTKLARLTEANAHLITNRPGRNAV